MILSALGHPDRLRIVEELLGGPATQAELVRRLDLSQPSVSRHMALLTALGLVERASPRGACSLTAPLETQEVLGAAQALGLALLQEAAPEHDRGFVPRHERAVRRAS